MTVHAIEIWTNTNITSSKTPQELKTQVGDYVANAGEVLVDQNTSFSKREYINMETGEVEFEYYRVLVRMETKSEETFEGKKQAIKDNMEAFLDNNFSVWQWRYHECDHDKTGNERNGCSWEAKNHSNVDDIPDDVEF